jgi:hypothetical protein
MNPHSYGTSPNSLLQSGVNLDVKNKVLEDIQTWTLAFEGRPHLSYVKTAFSKLKSEGSSHCAVSNPKGFQFPDVGPVTASFVDSSAVQAILNIDLHSATRMG